MNPIPIQTARATQPGPSRAGPMLPATDARWVLAARACLAATGPSQIDPGARERLIDWAGQHGIAPIHAAAIIAMGEMAAARGGLCRADAARLATLPEPAPPAVLGRHGQVCNIIMLVLAIAAGVLFIVRWL